MESWYVNGPGRGGNRGFGLAEQLMTLAVLAVVTAMAVPSFHRMREGHELRMAQSDYIAALKHARSLAVNEQVRVILCPSLDARTCSGDDSWSQGWLIGKADLDNKGQLLGSPRYVGGKYSDALVIRSNGSQKYLWFGPDGGTVNSFQTLSFCMKNDPPRVLRVIVARTGRIRGDHGNSDASPCVAVN